MAVEKSKVGSDLHPYQLTQEQLFATGRVMRACAEIEHIVTLYLYRLAKIAPGVGEVLIGRLGIAAKIELAKKFARGAGGPVMQTFTECFESPNFKDLLQFRNTMAHGILLGKTDMDTVAFQVAQQVSHTSDAVSLAVNTYNDDAFAIFADFANQAIPSLEHVLGLVEERQAVLTARLLPY